MCIRDRGLYDRRKSSRCIQDEMAQCNVKLSARTVFSADCRNLVYMVGFHKKAIFISQRLERLNWAKTHINWTAEQWDSVIWSDETKISLFSSDYIKYIRRRIREDLHPDFITPTVKYPVSVLIRCHMTSKVRAFA